LRQEDTTELLERLKRLLAEDPTLAARLATITGDGNVVGDHNVATVNKLSGGDYTIHTEQLHVTLSPDQLRFLIEELVSAYTPPPLPDAEMLPLKSTEELEQRVETRERTFLEQVGSLKRQLAEAEENLRLVRERKSEFVQQTDIPLQLIKNERRLEQQIGRLQALLAQVPPSQQTAQPVTPMESSRRLKVFLCHASGDKPAVRDLYHRLCAAGIAPWLDEESLLPGQDWQLEIPKAVRSSDAVIICLSRKAITKAGYVQKEIKDALDVADEQPEGTIFLIPLRLEECEVPERLRRWQWVNLFQEKGYERLLRALQLRAESLQLALPYTDQEQEDLSTHSRKPKIVHTPPERFWTDTHLLAEMLSGNRARVQEAVARLEEQEAERKGPLYQVIREQLLQTMRDPARPARERVSAGDALALVGDSRFCPDTWYLPDEPLLGFVKIPEGPFLMGSDKARDPDANDAEMPQHEVALPTYYIARYPVTVAQFRTYVKDIRPSREGEVKGWGNHPMVGVNWNEALGYCRWLTEKLRGWKQTPEWLTTLLRKREWAITLPSEAEWEKAARGGLRVSEGLAPAGPSGLRIAFRGENPNPGHVYPWGDRPDPNRANYSETEIGTTSAVGCFLGGVSPYGVEDLSGNVWEWTRSLWGMTSERPQFRYPYDLRDGRENLEASQPVRRVLRGGSFNNESKDVRCTYRISNEPNKSGEVMGFRVVVARAPR